MYMYTKVVNVHVNGTQCMHVITAVTVNPEKITSIIFNDFINVANLTSI